MKSPFVALLVYIIVAIAEITAEYLNMPSLRFVSKPLLMLALSWYYYQSCDHPLTVENRILLLALVFAWFGDVILLFSGTYPQAFLFGLIAFLICHILYISHFSRKVSRTRGVVGFVFENKFIVLPFIAYAYMLLMLVYSNLNEMAVPVIIYCSVIMMMALVALNRIGKTNSSSGWLIFIGALFFMFSDSTIALNRFTSIFAGNNELPAILIMSLYIVGQFLIVEGSVQHDIKSS